MGRHAAFDSTMAVFARDSIPFPTGPTRFIEMLTRHDYDGAEKFARAMADTAKPFYRGGSQEAVANMMVLRGRLHEAEQLYAQSIETRARVRGDTISPYVVAHWLSSVTGELAGNRAKALAILDSTLRAYPVGSQPVARDQSQLLALGYAELGEAAKARSIMNQHFARLDSLGRTQQYLWQQWLQGAIALADGKPDSAVVYSRRADLEADGLPMNNGTVFVPLTLGQAFDKAGKPDSARKYLTQYAEMAGNGHYQADPVNMAPTLFRLGQLYQDAGDTVHAMQYYGRFVDLWKNADPELQPRVAEAKKAMGEMVGDKGRR